MAHSLPDLLPEGLFSFCFCDTKVSVSLAGSLLDFNYWSSFLYVSSPLVVPSHNSSTILNRAAVWHPQTELFPCHPTQEITPPPSPPSPSHTWHLPSRCLIIYPHSWQRRRKTPLDIFIFICLPSVCLPPSPDLHYTHTLDYNLYFFLFTSLEENLALKSILVE